MSGATIRAVAVHPGKADSMHVRDVPRPSVDDIPGGRGVLVNMIRVGLCGTDREINAAEFGEAPAGDDFLIIGHENLGRIEAVGPNVPSTLKPGGLVVATVRRPGTTIYDLIGLQDMTTGEDFTERGIRRAARLPRRVLRRGRRLPRRAAGVAREGRRAARAALDRREGHPPGV